MNRDKLLTELAMNLADWPSAGGFHSYKFVGEKLVSQSATFPIQAADTFCTRAEWLAERERLINKPCWDEAPEWAEWLAQDAGGQWHWHQSKPVKKDKQFDVTDDGKISISRSGACPAGHDWRQALEQRPDTLTTSLGASEWDEERIDIIGSNGATGEHYSSEAACSCGSVVGEYHNPECAEVDAFQAWRIKGVGSDSGLAYSAEAWCGEGLPPVGACCEVLLTSGRWEPVKIEAYGREHALFTDMQSRERVEYLHALRHRPIRSDEDRAVEEMVDYVSHLLDVTSEQEHDACRALYKAGYRKLETTHE